MSKNNKTNSLRGLSLTPRYSICGKTKKRGYFSEIDAKIAIASINRGTAKDGNKSIAKRVYFCYHCKNHHTTSQPYKGKSNPKN